MKQLSDEVRRILPILEGIEDSPLWAEFTAGTGVATLKELRKALNGIGEARKLPPPDTRTDAYIDTMGQPAYSVELVQSLFGIGEAQPWVGLTDEEVQVMAFRAVKAHPEWRHLNRTVPVGAEAAPFVTELYRAIESKLREKNAGQPAAYVDRAEAVNLARNMAGYGFVGITPHGVEILCEAILRMDSVLSAQPAADDKAVEPVAFNTVASLKHKTTVGPIESTMLSAAPKPGQKEPA